MTNFITVRCLLRMSICSYFTTFFYLCGQLTDVIHDKVNQSTTKINTQKFSAMIHIFIEFIFISLLEQRLDQNRFITWKDKACNWLSSTDIVYEHCFEQSVQKQLSLRSERTFFSYYSKCVLVAFVKTTYDRFIRWILIHIKDGPELYQFNK